MICDQSLPTSLIFSAPKRDSQKGGSVREPEMIRRDQAILANLRVDSRESGHLREIERERDFGTLTTEEQRTLSPKFSWLWFVIAGGILV